MFNKKEGKEGRKENVAPQLENGKKGMMRKRLRGLKIDHL